MNSNTSSQTSDFFANLSTGANMTTTAHDTSADFLAQTGWTPEAAFEMAIELRTDKRLFGSRPARRNVRPVDNFEAITGWSREDAFAEAVEHRSDERLYGTRH